MHEARKKKQKYIKKIFVDEWKFITESFRWVLRYNMVSRRSDEILNRASCTHLAFPESIFQLRLSHSVLKPSLRDQRSMFNDFDERKFSAKSGEAKSRSFQIISHNLFSI